MTDESESWRQVVGWENLYEVSDRGRVRSVARQGTEGRALRCWPDSRGYVVVHLWAQNARVARRVHLMVLAAFRGPRPDGLQARHLDDVKVNNLLENLVWGTASENTLDKVRNGLHPMAARLACPRGHPYDEANIRWSKGRRHCRTCDRERSGGR